MTDTRFTRTELLIGPAGLRRLAESKATVVGLGAVGSYAVEALARCGVGNLRLVDFDVIRPSNINRQLYALESTIGRPKVELARERVLDINPACRVEVLRQFMHVETMDEILGPVAATDGASAVRPDIIIDAIDSLTPKVELLTAIAARHLRVVSSMGAARRTDPTAIRIGPLKAVRNCPLARWIRKRLRGRGVALDFPCVYSIELPPDAAVGSQSVGCESVGGEVGVDQSAAPTTSATLEEEDFLIRGRKRRPMGSLPTITGIFGLMTANTAVKMLLEQ